MPLPINIFTPGEAAILLGMVALLGACMGSFINCLAWRMVHGESVLHGRSHCPACDHALGPLDLVPIVSWLALRGRCRHCKAPVSPRYALVELVMAIVFVALAVVHGFGIPVLAYMALATILMGAALVDLDTFTIPNGFVVAALLVWAASVGFMAPPANGSFGVGSLFVSLTGFGWASVALDGLAGGIGVGAGILLFSIMFDAATKRASLGGGDVKLLFAVGLFLGLAGSLLNLLIACIAGLVFALVRGLSASPDAVADGAADSGSESFRTKAIPFGPAISFATVLTLLVGPAALTWYTGLFL